MGRREGELMRRDLLAITEEDVVTLTNRGTLKRVQRELEKGGVEVEFTETEGALRGEWSDGIICLFGPDENLTAAQCSCGSQADICRHLLRTLFAYQALSEGGEDSGEVESWDPGQWSEEARAACFPDGDERRGRRIWNRGLVMELSRGGRPEARFHRLGHLVRFVIPGDPAGGVCDCTEEAPCIHVLLASWGFQKLPEADERGIVAVGRGEEEPDPELLNRAELVLGNLVEEGIAGAGASSWSRLKGVVEELDDAGLRWLAQILEELLVQREAYRKRSARFSPREVLELVGEFSLRVEVSRSDDGGGLPRFFVVGHKQRGESTFGPATVMGLGSEVRMQGEAAELLAFAQDTGTGRIVAISRIFEPDGGGLPSFHELGSRQWGAIPSIHELGGSRTVIEKARVTSSLRLRLGRTPVGIYEPSLRWEEIRPPIRVESNAELLARLEKLPPSSLRPRQIGGGFFVCPVEEIQNPRYCIRTQAVRATLKDDSAEVELFHPYLRRNASGTEALLAALQSSKVLFVAGHVRPGPAGWSIEPTAVLLEEDDGRRVLQPWLDERPQTSEDNELVREETVRDETGDDGSDFRGLQTVLEEYRKIVADVALLGREEGRLRCAVEIDEAAARCSKAGLRAHHAALKALRQGFRPDASPAEFREGFFMSARLARWCLDLPLAFRPLKVN